MDFFGILFDMKNGKKIPYSKNYFDTLFAENLAGVTTLTGTLPLTFTTSETTLRSWTIYGNSTPHNYSAEGTLPLTFTSHTADEASDWEIYGNAQGVGERTVNLFDFQQFAGGTQTTTNGGLTFTRDNDTIVISNSSISNYPLVFLNDESGLTVPQLTHGQEYSGKLFISNAPRGSNIYVDVVGKNQGGDWTWIKNITASGTSFTLSTAYDIYGYRLVCQGNGILYENTQVKFVFVKGSTVPSSYVPFGYEIPISVNDTPQTFYIGSSPLTAGQSISKTSTGVDIDLFEGSNTISTSLYNKPEMSIEGVDYVGVGEPTNDGWQIPLTVSGGTNTTTVNVPIDAPLTEGESVTDTLTINTFEGENTISTTLTNKPNMSITYKGG